MTKGEIDTVWAKCRYFQPIEGESDIERAEQKAASAVVLDYYGP